MKFSEKLRSFWQKFCHSAGMLLAALAAGFVALRERLREKRAARQTERAAKQAALEEKKELEARAALEAPIGTSVGPTPGQVAKSAALFGGRAVARIVGIVIRVVVTVILIAVTTAMMFMCIFMIYIKTTLYKETDLRLEDYEMDLSSVVYYTDPDTGEYEELVTLAQKQNRVSVALEEIPDYVKYAAVAIEDKRFYDHDGVDWSRTASAFARMFLSNSGTVGGSTITQQLIKNEKQADEVTVQRKLREIFTALELEKNYTKDQIMERYLNVIYFGHRRYGIGAASQYYFNKDVSDLTVAEAAAIIGITNNPSIYSPYIHPDRNKERQQIILSEMYSQGYLTKEEYEEAKAQELVFARRFSSGGEELVEEEVAPVVQPSQTSSTFSWYVDALIEDLIDHFMELYDMSYKEAETELLTGGYSIYCTYNPKLQEKVDTIYTDLSVFETESPRQLQSAFVLTDPKTGDILAIAGGVGDKEEYGSRCFNRATMATRPSGSSIKRLSVYTLAMELGLITPDTLVEDTKYVRLNGTTWMTTNSSNSYRGIITIRTALARSVNTIAAQIIDRVTPNRAWRFLQETYHITTLTEADDNYAPMSLGGLTHGVKVVEMAQAYSAIANEGIFTYNRYFTRIENRYGKVVLENDVRSELALSPKTAYWVRDMMRDAVAYGTGTAAQLENMPVAGKTGTTTDNFDRWFIGITADYVGALWLGYDRNEEIVWSGNPAPQIWHKVMELVCEGMEPKEFHVPADTRLAAVPGVTAQYFTIQYVDENGTVLGWDNGLSTIGRTVFLTPISISGYTCLSGTREKAFTITETDHVFQFVYRHTG